MMRDGYSLITWHDELLCNQQLLLTCPKDSSLGHQIMHTKRKFQLEDEGSYVFLEEPWKWMSGRQKVSSIFSEALKSLLKGLLSILPFSNQWKFPSRPFCDDDVTRKSTCDHFFPFEPFVCFCKKAFMAAELC